MSFEIENGVLKKYTEEDGVREVFIPESASSISEETFRDCTEIVSVTIPDTVTSIGNFAFSGCTSLSDINIPDSVKSIGEGAFYKCDRLADKKGFVIIRNVLYSYHGYDDIVTIPDGVTAVGDYAFADSFCMAELIIPDSVTNIGKGAFKDCRMLKKLTISGYTVDAEQYDFDEIQLSDLRSMLKA